MPRLSFLYATLILLVQTVNPRIKHDYITTMETSPLTSQGVANMDQYRRKEDLRREVLNLLEQKQEQRLIDAMQSWRDYFAQQSTITNNNQNGRK
jgi:hypothetical protein